MAIVDELKTILLDGPDAYAPDLDGRRAFCARVTRAVYGIPAEDAEMLPPVTIREQFFLGMPDGGSIILRSYDARQWYGWTRDRYYEFESERTIGAHQFDERGAPCVALPNAVVSAWIARFQEWNAVSVRWVELRYGQSATEGV